MSEMINRRYGANFFELSLTPRLKDAEKLYFRGENFELVNGDLVAINAENSLLFNTFFGAISIAKLKLYTAITKLVFRFDISGEFEIEICTETEKITSRTLPESGDIVVDLADIPDMAKLLYPILHAKTVGNRLHKISVFAENETEKEINCALIVCTYKREESVIKNVNYLSSRIDENCRIMVVDNGRTLSKSDFAKEVILIPNANTGGSGGFKKGMETACQMGGFTHFLLMDDDIEIDISAVQKLVNFLRYLKPEYKDVSVAGSMLYLDKPTYQFEAGGHFYEDGSQKGFGHYLDLSEPENLYQNEEIKDINYGGWWYMLMPARYAYEGKFPLPFFIKYDDVEYALRCKLHVITLNGVGVWHEKFESKYNAHSEYYNTRNYLLLRSLHGGIDVGQARKIAQKRLYEKLCRQQYNMAQAVLLGYRDYLKGLEYLDALNVEENHRRICALNYELLTEEELLKRHGVSFSEEKWHQSETIQFKRYMQILLYGQSVPKVLCRKVYAVTDTFFDRKEMYFGYKKVLHFDRQSGRGYVTEKKIGKFLYMVFQLVKSEHKKEERKQ